MAEISQLAENLEACRQTARQTESDAYEPTVHLYYLVKYCAI